MQISRPDCGYGLGAVGTYSECPLALMVWAFLTCASQVQELIEIMTQSF